MKLRNKKTGEIGELNYHDGFLQVVDAESPLCGNSVMGEYATFSAINEEWEDYEEPKNYYLINLWGQVSVEGGKYQRPGLSELGLTFETKEEAEEAVEKLKAWKRLKENHFKFDEYDILNQTATWLVSRAYDQYENDIKLLFGGEE